MEKKSVVKNLIDKLINRLKNTALFNIFLNPEAGMVVSSEDLSSEDSISQLATTTGMSEREITNIDRAFNEADFSLSGIRNEVTKIPEEKKESVNPFKVDESELNLNFDENSYGTRSHDDGREIDD